MSAEQLSNSPEFIEPDEVFVRDVMDALESAVTDEDQLLQTRAELEPSVPDAPLHTAVAQAYRRERHALDQMATTDRQLIVDRACYIFDRVSRRFRGPGGHARLTEALAVAQDTELQGLRDSGRLADPATRNETKEQFIQKHMVYSRLMFSLWDRTTPATKHDYESLRQSRLTVGDWRSYMIRRPAVAAVALAGSRSLQGRALGQSAGDGRIWVSLTSPRTVVTNEPTRYDHIVAEYPVDMVTDDLGAEQPVAHLPGGKALIVPYSEADDTWRIVGEGEQKRLELYIPGNRKALLDYAARVGADIIDQVAARATGSVAVRAAAGPQRHVIAAFDMPPDKHGCQAWISQIKVAKRA